MSQFNLDVIADYIAKLTSKTVEMVRDQDTLDTEQDAGTGEPEPTQIGRNRGFNDMLFWVTKVLSADGDSRAISGIRMDPTSSSSKWVASAQLTQVITVDIPDNLTMPVEGDIIMAHFTGVYAAEPDAPKPRYGLFGGGGGAIQVRINSEFGDYLGVTKVASGTTTGTVFNVAKPYALRQTPFDGQTIGGVTRTYSSSLTRVASNSDFGQVEVIVPSYIPGVSLIYITATDHTDVFVSGSELKFLDLNTDGRVWASGE